MKSILLIGTKDSGKSTTVREVCRRLNPTKVYKLSPNKENLENSSIKLSEIDEIYNNTFIIEVQGKWILVVAGAPTEQGIRITVIIEICIKIKIDISFAIVSMRSSERTEGFATETELENKSEIILKEWISKISGEEYMKSNEWVKRIDRLSDIVIMNI